jgi:hypothetical protein
MRRFKSIGLYMSLLLVVGCGGGGSSSSIPVRPASVLGVHLGKAAASGSSTDPYTALVMNDAPLAYYRLNDTGSVMADSSGFGLNGVFGTGVVEGAAPLTSAQDASALLPGSPAGSDVPANTGTVLANAAFTAASTALTVEAWVKPAALNGSNGFAGIAAYGFGAIGNAWALSETPQSSLDLYMKVNGGAGSYEVASGNAKLLASKVSQVVATYDGSTVSLYLNGYLVASKPASGTINYSGISSHYGLAIGGELGISRPIFNGAINDVSIYPTALSAAEITKHFLTGQLAQPVVETPSSSDAFVDSIGVVTHLRSTGTQYTNAWPTFLSLMQSSGIRHIGDALIGTPSWYPQRIQQLASSGIHASLITDLTQSSQSISAAIPLFSSAIEALQGPNEVDLTGDSNWIADTRTFQQMLWSTVKGNQATANLTVLGPSVVNESDFSSLGDLSAYMDKGSMHDYFSGYNPGTVGWGGRDQYGIYGSIAWNKNVCAVVSGTKPIQATETGYSSSPLNSGSIDSSTLAKYIPRTYLEHYLNGVSRSTVYEFYDEPGNSNFSQFGLVDVNNVPKSSYYAIKNIIALLGDPGAAYSPKSVSYLLTGNVTNVAHLLLQKRDGTNEMVLWLETQGYDPNTKTDIAVPAQSVILQPTNVPTSASVTVIGDNGSATSKPLTFSSGTANLSIDDHVSVVTFK